MNKIIFIFKIFNNKYSSETQTPTHSETQTPKCYRRILVFCWAN